MTTKKMLLILAIVMVGVIFLASGCKKAAPDGTDNTVKAPADVDLCLKCGQVKGSDVCCKPDAVKCDKCGLAKGSPGCCKLPKP